MKSGKVGCREVRTVPEMTIDIELSRDDEPKKYKFCFHTLRLELSFVTR